MSELQCANNSQSTQSNPMQQPTPPQMPTQERHDGLTREPNNEVISMENENTSVANNVPQTSTSDNPSENVVNPMKAVSAPLMPTMLKFAQQQQQSDGSNENSPQE